MKKNMLGATGLKVTPVGMGVLTIGKTQMDLSLDEGAEIIRYALDSGINFLDTAEYYETYPYIREALKNSIQEPVIASKSLSNNYDGMKNAVDACRKALNRDVIDIFLLHEVRTGDDRSQAWKYLLEARTKGIIKAIGVSTHHVDITEHYADIDDCDVIFPLINFQSLGIRNKETAGTKEDMKKAIGKAIGNNKGVFAMKVFGGGNLTGKYIEAMDYVSSIPGLSSMMIGIGHKHEIDIMIKYIEGNIERDYVPDIKNKKIHIDQGDCEGCGTCISVCPNKAISLNSSGCAKVNHDICITCGYCAPSCPVRAIIMY